MKTERRLAVLARRMVEPATLIDSFIRSLGFQATEVRGRDELDFHEVHVATLRDALEKTYAAGRAAATKGLREARKTPR